MDNSDRSTDETAPLIDMRWLRAFLALRGMTLTQLAHALGRPTSTLSSQLHGVAPQPGDLAAKIEAALRLPRGALTGADDSLAGLTPEPTGPVRGEGAHD